jgi:predicted DNA-binding transcriptional regulator YafY
MSRIFRLHQLLQAIRSEAQPVTAQRLGDLMGVSQRTIHRDIATLRELGAGIDGAAGYGFSLGDDMFLPELTFKTAELEALVLGLREVEQIGDTVLAQAASRALRKLQSRLPKPQALRLKHSVLSAKHFNPRPEISIDVGALREATWDELEVRFQYQDAVGTSTIRQVRPLSIVYLEQATCLISYCLLRKSTRAFRLDRMTDLEITSESFRPHRVSLLRAAMEDVKKSSIKRDKT